MKVIPLAKKRKARDTLKTFCSDFGVPEKIVFDGSKEQTAKGTQFMKQIRKHNIDFHVAEPEQHNEVPAEGVVCQLRRKWFCVMILQRALLGYGIMGLSGYLRLTL